ncbi:glycerol kinase GlpK [Thalassospira lucentensis]|uniref:glycerol kinase GlpK n=1 Tax=Thalassospira lucentensis TaxID=168935 RepID=UPI002942F2A4|nr:glycerol kinase GlpK [Thalassospira lucentensis]WOI11156.1 glycerol kinase GlpK [Thalassospira lucentensis]
MTDTRYILAIDQGTTSSRAIVFDANGRSVAVAQQEFPQHFPNSGWVEHDPEDLWDTVVAVCREALSRVDTANVAAIGITNQRETTVVWDRKTGKAVYNAIVWQDRRTAALCHDLKRRDLELETDVNNRSGLLIDPYFSATKVAWILDHVTGARARAEQGDLAFGTVDSFLLWRLTGGRSHATDATNAARTNLFNIRDNAWDERLCEIFRVPKSMLPEVKDCAADFGMVDAELFGREIPVLGMAGDQQAAAFGQCCFEPGDIKSTYGTGCFVILNTGDEAVTSQHRLLTTVGYRLNGKTSYAIEGAIFVAGAAVQWLRDGLGIIKSAAESEGLAKSLDDNHGVYLVPAFTGLGAPYWDPDARGAIFGLTRDTGPREFVRAALESVCYQTFDLFEAMAADGVSPKAVRVDGGMVANDWLCQYLSDILDIPVQRPVVTETTALGAAYLAGLQAGIYRDLGHIAENWHMDAEFKPELEGGRRNHLLAGWKNAVKRVMTDQG